MKVIVTGGAGFIGSHLVEKLINQTEVKKIIIIDNFLDGSKRNLKNCINSKKLKILKADICNYKKITKYFKGVKIVYHLAAMSDIVPSIIEPIKYMNSNIMGTLNILEAMRSHKVKKIIYAASSSCYGVPKKYPTSELELINPKYPYAFSKYISELFIKHWSNVYKINYVSLRLFNVYGTRSRTTGAYGAAIGVFLKQKISNKPYTIVGDGNQKRDFVNVKDVADAFILAGNSKKKNMTYNVGTGRPTSVNKLVRYLGGKKVNIPKRPGEPYITHANIKLIKKNLKWMPKINFRQGINEILKNKNYWKNSPLWTPNKIKKATKDWFKYLK